MNFIYKKTFFTGMQILLLMASIVTPIRMHGSDKIDQYNEILKKQKNTVKEGEQCAETAEDLQKQKEFRERIENQLQKKNSIKEQLQQHQKSILIDQCPETAEDLQKQKELRERIENRLQKENYNNFFREDPAQSQKDREGQEKKELGDQKLNGLQEQKKEMLGRIRLAEKQEEQALKIQKCINDFGNLEQLKALGTLDAEIVDVIVKKSNSTKDLDQLFCLVLKEKLEVKGYTREQFNSWLSEKISLKELEKPICLVLENYNKKHSSVLSEENKQALSNLVTDISVKQKASVEDSSISAVVPMPSTQNQNIVSNVVIASAGTTAVAAVALVSYMVYQNWNTWMKTQPIDQVDGHSNNGTIIIQKK